MKKGLSLLKPCLCTDIMNSDGMREKIKYLQIPGEETGADLKGDVKKGRNSLGSLPGCSKRKKSRNIF